jgi:hypothetical protein
VFPQLTRASFELEGTETEDGGCVERHLSKGHEF